VASIATIQFFADWRRELRGTLERGGTLRIDYDKARLPRCFAMWRGAEVGDIVALVRFHPRGEIFMGSVVSATRDGDSPPGPVKSHVSVPLDLSVPGDATQAEIWFHNFYQTTDRCDAWDSHFGDNYWFQIDGLPPRAPAEPVVLRSDAGIHPEMVNALEQSAAKINSFPHPIEGRNLETVLKVVAWVKETTYGAGAWIDVHVFDGDNRLIQAKTWPMTYTGFGSTFQYAFSGTVYQGSTATPGSVSPRPDARTIQYRLYYDVNYHVFTDGILHQHDLPEDAQTQ